MGCARPGALHCTPQANTGLRALAFTYVWRGQQTDWHAEGRRQPHLGDATYVHHGLGAATQNGNWHTITRNLEQDLKEAQPDNELQAILGFLIRGSGKVDGLKTKE